VEQSIRWIQAGQVLGSRIITHRISLDETDYGFQEMLERRAVKVYYDMEG
jgi:threonine dehydrogenase-like Zn-dependent dehydrogenase